jgi:hypothetical protein
MSLFGGIASAVGSIVGAGASYFGGQAQAKAADRAADRSYDIYQQQRKDFLPQMQLGQDATNRMRDIYLTGKTPFTASPGYDFRVQQGTQALERGAAARGRQFSGAQGKALTEYGQGVAADEYDRGYNRLAGMAGLGQTATGQIGQAGQVYANQANTAGQNAAAARASGYGGIGSSINSGINNMLTLRAMQGLY